MNELLFKFGKYAERMGEAWRLDNPELMDAYSAAVADTPAPETDLVGDCLPKGHVILEQADMPDGRVSQTVRAANGSEYERVVHADEAYGEEE